MSVTKDYIKSRFKAGDFPDEKDFGDLAESCINQPISAQELIIKNIVDTTIFNAVNVSYNNDGTQLTTNNVQGSLTELFTKINALNVYIFPTPTPTLTPTPTVSITPTPSQTPEPPFSPSLTPSTTPTQTPSKTVSLTPTPTPTSTPPKIYNYDSPISNVQLDPLPNMDSDNDGYSDEVEELYGTDKNDPQSFPISLYNTFNGI